MQAKELSTFSRSFLITSKVFLSILIVFEVIAWIIAKILTLILCRRRVIHLTTAEIEARKSYVIAASHSRMLDAFLIIGQLKLGTFIRILPIRFFAHNGLFNWWLRPFLLVLGCFPASEHPKYAWGIEAARQFLAKGQTVLIFPEGKRNRGEKLKPRKGVSILADQPGVEIIPVRITWNRGLIWGYSIVIGKPQQWAGRSADDILFDILTLE